MEIREDNYHMTKYCINRVIESRDGWTVSLLDDSMNSKPIRLLRPGSIRCGEARLPAYFATDL